ncbi:substrate-binding domain-containing protein [Roseovarius mucosus]|uniref:substrate-binding domain-containing protein n=1 Tax=Roseovarius mucosus TaxID=215743 RepID=UPI003F6E8415
MSKTIKGLCVKNGNQKSTIHDIARKVGVSASAVSAALNGTWQKRRLSKSTVERIKAAADEENYSVNLQARGLRKARSGLAGMVLPDHNNRYFAQLSQSFATAAHQRGLCPAIVHAGRDADEQARSVESLLAYAVDLIMVAGASEPDILAQICRDAGIPCVFVDHPCQEAPSVVSDNFSGSVELAQLLVTHMARPAPDDPASWIYFLGGSARLPATSERIRGFRHQTETSGLLFSDAQVIACGYDSARAEAELAALYQRLGRLPGALYVNSIDCFEGVVRFLARLPEGKIAKSTFGCFDYDPFGILLRFPLFMVRQRAEEIISKAFYLLEQAPDKPALIMIKPEINRPNLAEICYQTSATG